MDAQQRQPAGGRLRRHKPPISCFEQLFDALSGVVAGALGSGVVFGAFKILRQAESSETFSLQDMVGSTGRVSVAIPANKFGTVMISFAGASHNMTATADDEIPAGKQVKVVAVAGTNLVVTPISVTTNEGDRSDA